MMKEGAYMSYTTWFIPMAIVVITVFSLAILSLTVATLMFRMKVNKKYDRGKLRD